MAFQEALVLVARELATTIGVKHYRASVLALPKCHQYSLQHQLPVLAMTHGPADNNTRIEIEHNTQI